MLSAIIIGLGRIGIGRGAGGQENLPNHFKAITGAPFEISGLVDPSIEAQEFVLSDFPEFAPKLVQTLSDVPSAGKELIVICAPVEAHGDLLRQALDRHPEVIVLEKPVAEDFPSTKLLFEQSESHAGEILVNFHRRFDSRHQQWRSNAPDAPALVTARFGKGLWNYASHIVDLLLDWYGPVESVQALQTEPPGESDPNLSFRCRMAKGFDAILIGVDGVRYDQFEIDIYGNADKIEMRGGGSVIRRCRAVDDHYHKGYADLVGEDCDRGPVDGFSELYRHIADCHESGAKVRGCTLPMAVANAAVLDAALLSAARGGISVKPQYMLSERH